MGRKEQKLQEKTSHLVAKRKIFFKQNQVFFRERQFAENTIYCFISGISNISPLKPRF